jgi:hypothetical protein
MCLSTHLAKLDLQTDAGESNFKLTILNRRGNS